MNHEERRAKGRTHNDGKSLTDQSQASDTNINVILQKYGVTGHATGKAGEPQYIDHTTRPRDLREAFEAVQKAQDLRASLPEQLRERSIDELSALTHEQLTQILTPPAKPPEKTEEPPK